jgi:predicted phage terminase large subunit-like protein
MNALMRNFRAQTIEKIKNSLVSFRKFVLVDDDSEDYPSAWYHHKISDLLLNDPDNYLIEGFRESAKSSYIIRTYPIHKIVFPPENKNTLYIVLIKSNESLAKNKLNEIIRVCKTNEFVKANIKGIYEESKKAFLLRVYKENEQDTTLIKIEAYGKGSAIRGLVYNDVRPDIVLMDDIQDREDAKSIAQSNSDWDWFLSDVIFLGRSSRLFFISNNLGERCIAEKVYNAENLKEIKFSKMRIPVLTKNEDGEYVSNWPENKNFSVEKMLAERDDLENLGRLSFWYAERMCQAISDEARVFNSDDYKEYYEINREQIIRNCNITACLDPASSTKSEACYRAITVVGTSETNEWYVLDCKFGRWGTYDQIDNIFETVKQYKLKEFYMEKGQLYQILEPVILEEQKRRNIFFKLKELEHASEGSKLERIKALQPRFKTQQIFFPANPHLEWLKELKAELAGMTNEEIKSERIDLADSLAMHIQVATPPYGIAAQSGGVVRAVRWNKKFH